jgi:NAD(P)-dependent dehydrogenase (short-subunit alcohol dehydrogenase family)
VAFTYNRSIDAAESLKARIEQTGVKASHWPMDLTDYAGTAAQLEKIHRAFGRIHSVVYAAGPKITVDYVCRLDPEVAARVIQQDVIGFFHLARASLPILKNDGGGSITAITTTQGGNVEVRGALSASPKAAIESMIRTIAKEEARNNIRANALRAGWVDIGLGADLLSTQLSEKAQDAIHAAIPMRRFGTPEEIGEAVAFLASTSAGFITGVSLAADGGQHL